MLTFEEWRHTYADAFETDDAVRAAWIAAYNRGYRAGIQDTRELLAASASLSNQCVHDKGIVGDEGGTPCCPVTITPDAELGEPDAWIHTFSVPGKSTHFASLAREEDPPEDFSRAKEKGLVKHTVEPLYLKGTSSETTAPAQDDDWPEVMSAVQDVDARVTSATLQVGDVVTQMVPMSEPTAPAQGEPVATDDGYIEVSVKGLQDLDTALDRADSKGYLLNDIAKAWYGLDWRPVRRTYPQPAPAVAKEGVTEEQIKGEIKAPQRRIVINDKQFMEIAERFGFPLNMTTRNFAVAIEQAAAREVVKQCISIVCRTETREQAVDTMCALMEKKA